VGDEFFQGERAAQAVVVVDHIDIVNLVHILGLHP
jgi:ribosomal protein L14E/L6E/L27E